MIARLHKGRGGVNMKVKKVLKIIGVILLVLIVLLIIHTVRNYIIISNLQNKLSQYSDSKNYYIKSVFADYEQTGETWVKDDKYLVRIDNITEQGKRTIINYCDGKTVNTYIELDTNTNKSKIALLNSNGLPSPAEIGDFLATENGGQLILNSMLSSVKSEKLNDIDCYKITGFQTPNMLFMTTFETPCIYVEKDTGITIQYFSGTMQDNNGNSKDIIVNREYKFNTVTDDDLKEPDISQYTIRENN